MAFELPALPYGANALEPHIDEQTMNIHHGKHHSGYVAKLNAALEGTEYENWPLEKILGELETLPAQIRGAVRNNGGGHANHSLFWTILGPNAGGSPSGALAGAIEKKFGSFSAFQEAFSNAAATRFGSGWAWLVVKKDGTVDVYSTANQDSPLMQGDTPILGLDVWEHAYYLKYQNRRPDYIKAFFNLVNWTKVEEYYTAAK